MMWMRSGYFFMSRGFSYCRGVYNHPSEDGMFPFQVSTCFLTVISETNTGTVQGQNY